MFRSASVAVLALIAAALVSAAPVPEEAKPKPTPRGWQAMRDKLAKPISIEAIDPNTPLKEAIAFASEKFDFLVILDVEAFKADINMQEPDASPVKMPKMTDVRLETWLRMLLRQSQADFYVQPDGIISIVPRETLMKHVMAQQVTTNIDKARQ